MNTKALIGLGNPGDEYTNTRHNVGFEILDGLADLKEFKLDRLALNKRFYAEIVITDFLDYKLCLAKPMTYMNESGKAVLAIKNFYKIDLSHLLIVHDDVSLPLGKIRFQKEGSAGGQHGVESIIHCLGGDKKFNRLKIGIGPDPGGDVRANYVLQKFSKTENLVLKQIKETTISACILWLTKGIDEAMNQFNGFDLTSK